MRAYIEELRAAVAIDQAQRAEKNRVGTKATRQRLTPLDDRLSRLLSTIPGELQREGLSLAALQTGLTGRWRGNCHPGELGAGLRRLGFKRRRTYDGEAGFRALWYPPA